jgi:DNA-directed RNA polymerase subunit beta
VFSEQLKDEQGGGAPKYKAILTYEDMLKTVAYLVKLHAGEEGYDPDDIDHFGNRRLRSVGELIQNQIRIGLSRMERVVKERMTTQDVEAITPQTLINIRPVVASIKEFFGTSQLSQFMDQTNTLSGLTHKRRLSALGPGGLSRERAGFEVRDVHPSHYGRMCPIETPEGPNIGLIGSLSSFARINPFGFIETPYRRVEGGKVTSKIDYLSADEEDRHVIAQANTRTRPRPASWPTRYWSAARAVRSTPCRPPRWTTWTCRRSSSCRWRAALIPFLEHDDANRALMGANMQKQAVPLLRSEAPLVGTGVEFRAAVDAGDVVVALESGVVEDVSAEEIVVKERGAVCAPTTCRSSAGPTRAPARTRSRWSAPATRCRRARSSPTALHRGRRDRPGQEPDRGLHALGGSQLRRRDHPQRAAGQGRRPHFDPHRGARGRRP